MVVSVYACCNDVARALYAALPAVVKPVIAVPIDCSRVLTAAPTQAILADTFDVVEAAVVEPVAGAVIANAGATVSAIRATVALVITIFLYILSFFRLTLFNNVRFCTTNNTVVYVTITALHMKSPNTLLFMLLLCLSGILGILQPSSVFAKNTAVINHVHTTQKVVALTFDADMTPNMLRKLRTSQDHGYNQKIIDILVAEKVPATLFLTGMWIESHATATSVLSENPLFEIGNHSFSHPAFSSPCYTLATTTESDDAVQIRSTDQLLNRMAKRHVMLFRFPGLCYDADDVAAAKDAGYKVIGGDVLGGDGFQLSPAAIVANVVNSVRPGSIVVLHMMGAPNAPKTAEALPKIVTLLRAKGYRFVTVSDLLLLERKK